MGMKKVNAWLLACLMVFPLMFMDPISQLNLSVSSLVNGSTRDLSSDVSAASHTSTGFCARTGLNYTEIDDAYLSHFYKVDQLRKGGTPAAFPFFTDLTAPHPVCNVLYLRLFDPSCLPDTLCPLFVFLHGQDGMK